MVLFILDYHWYDISLLVALGHSIIEIGTYVILFYTALFCFNRFKTSVFRLSLAISLLILTYIILLRVTGLEHYFYEVGGLRNLFSMLLNASLFSGLAILFGITNDRQTVLEKNLLLQTKNKELQLINIKSRLNPHFIFNTLNNFNALILKKDKQLPDFINHFSTVLRYSIDDGNNIEIPLQKEINCIEAYFQLLELQSPVATDIDLYVEGNFNTRLIIPFVLTSLVENAIKHSDIHENENGHLHCQISCDDEGIHAEVSNTIGDNLNRAMDSGQGLRLIQEQLKGSYGEDFTFEQNIKAKIYVAKLHIYSTKTRRS